MHSDSSSSSRASSPDMDGIFLRDHHNPLHHHHHHSLHHSLHHNGLHHVGSSVSSSTQSTDQQLQKSTTEELHLLQSPSSGDDKSLDGKDKYKLKKQVTEEEMYHLRLKINGRERKRMHDLNLAMDGLREVMPYAHGPSVRKLSKIATLLLARNYILMLNSSLEEMKRLVGEIYGGGGGQHSAFHCGPVAHSGSGSSGGGGHSGAAIAAAAAAAAAAAHQMHPLLGSALPGLASIRAPHHAALMKGSTASLVPPPALQLGPGFQHWAGLPCPCTICQVTPHPPPPPPPHPAPPPHIPISSSGLTRLTAEGKEGMK